MNTIIWITQAILAAWFTMPAIMKLTSSKEKMIEKKQLPPDGSAMPIRILGLLEVLGVFGIILPQLTGIFQILTPITAVCFSVVMVGAFVIHYKKQEFKVLPMIAFAFILSLIVAYYRF